MPVFFLSSESPLSRMASEPRGGLNFPRFFPRPYHDSRHDSEWRGQRLQPARGAATGSEQKPTARPTFPRSDRSDLLQARHAQKHDESHFATSDVQDCAVPSPPLSTARASGAEVTLCVRTFAGSGGPSSLEHQQHEGLRRLDGFGRIELAFKKNTAQVLVAAGKVRSTRAPAAQYKDRRRGSSG